jgi:hypothetical protein
MSTILNNNYNTATPVIGEYSYKPTGTYKHQYTLVDNKVLEIQTVVVHQFQMGDVEDPDLYAAEPLMKWQNSDMGKWVMEHALESPMWSKQINPHSYGYSFAVTAKLLAKDYTYWTLKWGNSIDKV